MSKYVITDKTKQRLSALVAKSMINKDLDISLFADMPNDDWNELSFIAKVHTIDALIFNEVLSLDQSCLPPNSACLNMFALVESTKNLNRKVLDTLKYLKSAYDSMGLDFFVFKGPICAANYNNPLLRGVGDIDIFFPNGSDFNKANKWAENKQFVYHIDEIKLGHWSFECNNLIIEHHRDITFFEKNKYNIRFRELLSKELENNTFTNVYLTDDLSVKTFEIEISYLYVFLHLFYHFVHGGIGLRQFMDWMYMTIRYGKYIDKNKLNQHCKAFDIEYPISLFARVAVDYFAIDENLFPLDVAKSSSDSVLLYNDIMECGNFGILNTNYWHGKWLGRTHKFIKTIKRAIKIYHISPEYASRVPFAMFINRIYLSIFK